MAAKTKNNKATKPSSTGSAYNPDLEEAIVKHMVNELTEEPFKIVGSLIVCAKDKDGHIIGERDAGQVVFYASQFDSVSELVAEAWANRDKKQ